VIVGGRIVEVSGRKIEDAPLEGMNVNINIEDVKTAEGRLVIKYDYTIKYLPKVAEMLVKGELLVEESDKKRKEIEDDWKKKKQLPPEFAEETLTAITYTCSAVGTLIAFGLGITAPLNIPRAKLGPATPPLGSKAG
jgi:hypothetical protein